MIKTAAVTLCLPGQLTDQNDQSSPPGQDTGDARRTRRKD